MPNRAENGIHRLARLDSESSDPNTYTLHSLCGLYPELDYLFDEIKKLRQYMRDTPIIPAQQVLHEHVEILDDTFEAVTFMANRGDDLAQIIKKLKHADQKLSRLAA